MHLQRGGSALGGRHLLSAVTALAGLHVALQRDAHAWAGATGAREAASHAGPLDSGILGAPARHTPWSPGPGWWRWWLGETYGRLQRLRAHELAALLRVRARASCKNGKEAQNA